MCGIIGVTGRDDALDTILDGLARLEYRGYDSAGIAMGGESIDVVKKAGKLDNLREALQGEEDRLTGWTGLGHTGDPRWTDR